HGRGNRGGTRRPAVRRVRWEEYTHDEHERPFETFTIEPLDWRRPRRLGGLPRHGCHADTRVVRADLDLLRGIPGHSRLRDLLDPDAGRACADRRRDP